jgi:two-component system nitrate/nitrite response regulator NarL
MASPVRIGLIGGTSVEIEGLPLILPPSEFQLTCFANGIDELDLLVADGSLDVVMIEQQLDQAGWDQLGRLRSRFAACRVCLIADKFDFAVVVRAIRAGVDGFIPANISAEGLVESLRLIIMGETLLPSQLAGNLPTSLSEIEDRNDWATSSTLPLSRREVDVIRCLAMGCPNKVIARQLDITIAQTKVHLNAVLRKLSASNRTQAAIWAISHGLLGANGAFETSQAQPSVTEVAAPLPLPERIIQLA